MLFYFHGGDLGRPFILLIFFVVILTALLILAAFVWVLYIALHKPKNNGFNSIIFNSKEE